MTVFARTRSAALAGAICAGLTAVLVGCGGGEEDPDEGTNGLGKLSAPKIERKARQAAESADAVRLSGSVVSKGHTYRLDMRLKDNGGVGEVSTKGGSRFELLRVDKDLYLKADADFWVHQEQGGKEPSKSDREAARKLEGKYVKVPPGDPAYKQLSGFTEMEILLDGLLTLEGKRETGDRNEVSGVKTIQIQAGQGRGGTLEVSLIGTPYPLRLERGGGAGAVEMADWNKEFSLRAPNKDQIVDYGKQIAASD
ncbi:hypothetical protein [Streptomyces gobiensis]|uniref:hypothetical protein n=1 Tax=Streptomyces gobiensis TaxID=2875706 RepID=UPI001E5B29E0|nr:hypothetical protein [Streptomyces gobiensis]UGY93490.1 hypothetical protein test1122_18340 [Streptomyces gobiensis]